MSLVTDFDKLLGHLNAEENELALELRQELVKADIEIDKLACLEAGGVDNWDFYHDSLRDNNWIGFDDEEEEDEE